MRYFAFSVSDRPGDHLALERVDQLLKLALLPEAMVGIVKEFEFAKGTVIDVAAEQADFEPPAIALESEPEAPGNRLSGWWAMAVAAGALVGVTALALWR